MRTFEIESHPVNSFIRWACNGCGEQGPMWHRNTDKGHAAVLKGMATHTCRVRTCELPPVVIDETDPFARASASE